MGTTLKELAASGDLASRGAAARIKAGYADSTPLKDHCRSDVPARAARGARTRAIVATFRLRRTE
jgi:hypothetical protein